MVSATSFKILLYLKAVLASDSFLVSSLEKSSTSFTADKSMDDELSSKADMARWSSFSGVDFSCSDTPMMAFNGVRIS
ncbi:hypothetical protein D3C86_1702660 [compost metagenome]